MSFAYNFSNQPSAQLAPAAPMVYVLSVAGIILLATSAVIFSLSVGTLPRPISPSAEILPVACRSPNTVVLLNRLISSPPCGEILTGPTVLEIVFVEMYILPIVPNPVVLAWPGVSRILNTSPFIVPLTSKGYNGVFFLIPTLVLVTSRYRTGSSLLAAL